MKIECTLKRKGGTHVDIGGKSYHFAPQEDGRHVADVDSDAHIERFLAVPEAYRILRAPGADTTPVLAPDGSHPSDVPQPTTLLPGQVLYGSNAHPATFDIGGKTYQLGDIVLLAFQDSGLDVENWNDLDDDTRATKIDLVLDALEAGEITVEAAVAPASQPSEDDELAALVEQYKDRFGKSPRNMKAETIRAKLAAGLE